MMRPVHRRLQRAATLFAVAGVCLLASPSDALAAGSSQGAKRSAPDLEDELRDLAAFGFSGAVLVSDRAFGRVQAGFGSGADGSPLTSRTLFDIGSLSKQFTAAAVMALVTEGRVAREDSVGRFFPQAPAPFRGITVTQLLTHTSGLTAGNLTAGLERGELIPTPRDSALVRIFRSRPRFTPGADQAYSNAGYVLLAAIVERASGRPYIDYVRSRLLSRAGMADTRFWGERGTAVAAKGCDELGVVFDPDTAPLENWAIRGAGGILSSVEDLERWVTALTRGRVLPAAIAEEMMSARARSLGYGWRVGDEARYPGAVYHGGDFYGSGSQLLWYPESSRLVVILCNVRHENDTVATRTKAEEVILAALDGFARRVPQALGPTGEQDARIAGDYVASNGAVFSIVRGPGGLELGALDQRAVDSMCDAPADTRVTWEALRDRAERLVTAAVREDTSGVRRALAAGDDPPYVYEQLRREIQAIAGGEPVLTVSALGTYGAAQPPGAEWTVLALRTPKGAVPYRLRWYRDMVASYHARSPAVASPIPLARARSGWIAWSPVHQGTPIRVERGPTAGTLRFRRGDVALDVVRRDPSAPPVRSGSPYR